MYRILKQLDDLKKYDPTFDPYTLCQKLDIEILYFELGSILGFKTTYCGVSLIYINKDLPLLTKRFVIAHELGHIILHRGIKPLLLQYFDNSHFISQFENEADTFAIILLLCNHYVNDFFDTTTGDLLQELGIPKKLAPLFWDIFYQLKDNDQVLKNLVQTN